jgi:hypothetical protein
VAAGQVALFRGAVEGGFAGGCEAVGVNTEGEQDAHEGRVTWERRGGGGKRMNAIIVTKCI